VGLLAPAAAAKEDDAETLPHRWSAGLFLLGTQFFGSGLTLFVATQAKPFQMLAPIGGTALVGGWLHLAYDAARRVNAGMP